MDYAPELIAKAKTAKSAEELCTLAAENGLPITAEEAEGYFAQLHKEFTSLADAALSDEELENVAGGSSCKNGRSYSDTPPHFLIVSSVNSCPAYECSYSCPPFFLVSGCYRCVHKHCEGIVTYCTKRTRDKDPYR